MQVACFPAAALMQRSREGIYLLAGGQLHEAADKSRIPDPVQFYIYRRRCVVRAVEHGHAFLPSLFLSKARPRPAPLVRSPIRVSLRHSRFSSSRPRWRKEKQRKRTTEGQWRRDASLKGAERRTAAVVMRLCKWTRQKASLMYVRVREEGVGGRR